MLPHAIVHARVRGRGRGTLTRREVMEMEDEGKMTVQILGSEALYPEHLEMDCRDQNGERVEIDSL